MPDQISVSEFLAETLEDYKAPTASSFTTRTAQCRNTVAAVEEVSGSFARAGREARASGIALSPGARLGFRAWCPISSALRLRPHPGKVSGPPKPDAAGPAVPDTEALCSLL
uniref:Predicted gene, 21863 n=1 Tax=Mus musculus TaxID=10090 RepID=J3KMP8_MOUSE